MNPMGITAALATAVSWATCAIFFTSASRRVGTLSMNHYRTLFGTLLLAAAHIATFGTVLPAATSLQATTLLASGVIGVVIGDLFLFQAYLDIGPRLGMLVMSTGPILTALMAWPMLGERLGAYAWLGILVTMAGTVWVVAEEHGKEPSKRHRHLRRGLIFTLISAFCQSFGYVIAKPAMMGDHGVDPLSAALIRVAAGAAGFWIIGVAKSHTPRAFADFRNARAMLMTFGGAVTGPFIGIWLSLTALKLIPAGVASTLISTMPLVILPMVILVYRERVSWRAAVGAAIAVAGIAILFTS